MFSVDQVWIEDVVTDDLNNRLFGKVKGHSFSQKQQKPKRKDGAMLVNNTQLKDKVEDKGKLRKRKLGKPKDDLVLPKTKKLSKGGSEQTTFRQSVNRDCIPAVDKKKKLKKKRKREESDGNVKHTLNKNVVGTLQDTNLVLDVNEDCAKDNVKRKKKNRRKKKNASDQGSVEQLNSAESDYQTKCDGGMVRQKQTTEVFTGNDLRSKKASGMNSESARRNGPRKKLPFAPGKLTAALKINASYRPNDVSDKAGVPELISANRTSSSTAKQQNVNLSTRDKMKSKLEAARFRYLNEQLYTSSSREAVNMFREDPHAFNVYHAGFQSQVACWPVNPVDQIINYIKSRSPSLVVADFGCGDAKTARSVPNTVHSFDLVAVNKHVTVCDISKVPLGSNSVDIAVICLALMGNNWVDFLREASRVLKLKGVLKIVEVSSRLEDIRSFVKLLECLGFTLKHQDNSNKMFISFEFVKRQTCNPTNLPQVSLLPCLYKKR